MPYVNCPKCGGKGLIETPLKKTTTTIDQRTRQEVEVPVMFRSPCDQCGGSKQVWV